MNQIEFSNIVKEYISKKHPAFLNNISYKEEHSFDCSLKNAKEEFSIWIATYNSEITLGLESSDGNSDCHTHMSFYGEGPSEQLDAMEDYLQQIFTNKIFFVYSSLSGYSWTNNIEYTLKKRKKNETIEFFKWKNE